MDNFANNYNSTFERIDSLIANETDPAKRKAYLCVCQQLLSRLTEQTNRYDRKEKPA